MESAVETLVRLGVVQRGRVKRFSDRTRDRDGLPVSRDEVSKVIFIEDHYVGDATYETGEYRRQTKPLMTSPGRDHEDLSDTSRRFERYAQFFAGRRVCDFGCGAGSFLRRVKPVAAEAIGVELNDEYRSALERDGVTAMKDLSGVQGLLDTAFLFHSFEHLPRPAAVLRQLHARLKSGGEGRIVIEVPHAKDFLIDALASQPFIDFTLWSQHLVLHTRESLNAILQDAGFRSIAIEGVQRYGIANHLSWLKDARPGGHKSPLSVLETAQLTASYATALSTLDANDTLVAVAST
jgi:SAM-dependent methyltransferase